MALSHRVISKKVLTHRSVEPYLDRPGDHPGTFLQL
uniref:Uncharacterized protein n=1 Tax=Anguilla anguilla TaxID=7936 RepID=A0A0E9VNQ4_ANGAN